MRTNLSRIAALPLALLLSAAMPVSNGATEPPATEQRAQKFEDDAEYDSAHREWTRLLAAAAAHSAAHAEALRRLAWIDYRLGNLDTAQKQLLDAQAEFRALPGDHRLALARTLNSLGVVRRDGGDYGPAQGDLETALSMLTAQEQRHTELGATVHNNLAGLSYYRSDYRKALHHYRLALEIFQELLGPSNRDVGGALNNVGIMYKELGASIEAQQYLERALVVKEQVLGPAHPSVALTITNLADLSATLGEDAKAVERYDRALQIFEKALGAEHTNVAHVLANRAEYLNARANPAQARADLQRALAIREKSLGVNSNWTAETLVILASVQVTLGDVPAAQVTAQRALSLAVLAEEDELLCNAYAAHARVLDAAGNPRAAVLFGKHAVNVIQKMRADVATLDQPLQQSFLARRSRIYRDLAERLVTLGRLSEAEQILTMLKEEEYFDYVRNAVRSADTGNTRAQFSQREKPAAQQVAALETSLRAAIAADKRAAGADSTDAVPATRDSAAALDRFTAALRGVASDLAALPTATASDDFAATLAPPAGVAELQYFLSPQRMRVLVRTATSHRAYDIERGARVLNPRIFALRQDLQDPASRSLQNAQALHADLIAPFEALLTREKIQTLRVVLDGTLRYVPFAALHDGRSFVVQKYSVGTLTTANLAIDPSGASAANRIAAFGVSRQVAGLPALPRVRSELERIVRQNAGDRDGVVPGTLVMDEAFTQPRLTNAFRERVPLIHLATHFVFKPGALSDSYLVLGDGSQFSLERLQSDAPDLSAVRLLTLSACSSALGDDAGAGRELESFGTLAQRLGAREVLATLWPVTDSSTAILMANTYRAKAQRNLTTAQSLRQAQLALLEKHSPWRHPAYWAPFVTFSGR